MNNEVKFIKFHLIKVMVPNNLYTFVYYDLIHLSISKKYFTLTHFHSFLNKLLYLLLLYTNIIGFKEQVQLTNNYLALQLTGVRSSSTTTL